jgi:homoserine O-acetyltransferase
MPELTNIESKLFSAREFRLESGQTLPVLELAYETYGTLSAAKDNAILMVHGYTSSHHAAGKNVPGKEGRGVVPGAAGWFDKLIGPGKAIDTGKFFVIAVNALGSAHGSSGPNTIDPSTGKPYGPTFPHITLRDMVASQKLLVDSLGLKSLVAVVGPSMGGFQSFQWAASYPGFMKGIAASVTAPKAPSRLGGLEALQKRLASDPNWNSGWYYENGGIPKVLEEIRYDTLLNYGATEADARAAAKVWAKMYDGHSLVALRRASSRASSTS